MEKNNETSDEGAVSCCFVLFVEGGRVIICMLFHGDPPMVTRSGSQLTMVAHAFNARIREAEAEGCHGDTE